MTDNKKLVVVEKDFMLLCQQVFMLSAQLLDDWEELFPALHMVWDKNAQEVFPYEICQHMEDLKDVIREIERLADVKVSETIFSGVAGEA